ncbi:MAG TPA: hypothetical protein VHZ73_08390 [Vicinamibacterales bacterium]|nr:hypothetical protein [Vicinamibacterales bacterium]
MSASPRTKPLQLAPAEHLSAEQHAILEERRQRRARIDALTPDRSRLLPLNPRYWLPSVPPEALAAERITWREEVDAENRLNVMRELLRKAER